MSINDPISTGDAALVDSITSDRYRTQPVVDHSGMLAPAPPLRPPRPGESEEDALFDVCMRRYFPQCNR
jgi:hypothetical protein